MSLTFVFSQGKPCCKNNVCKGKVSCKFNQASIDTDKDAEGKLTAKISNEDQKFLKCNTADSSKCVKSGIKKPWWKFWVKKKNCCNTKV